MNELCSRVFRFPLNKCIPLGYPRNDEMINANLNLSLYFGHFKKYIIWYPTVRQFKGGGKTGSKEPIPILFYKDNAIKLNKSASKLGVLIIIKPHFAQATEYIKKMALSNIRFINDDFFLNNNISSYSLVGSCDALLTDYSSVYYDYLLKNRPIGLIWEDLEEYKKNPGVIKEFDFFMKGGIKIYNCNDLVKFIETVSKGEDSLMSQRREICSLANVSTSPDNAARVTNFIIEKSGLRM